MRVYKLQYKSPFMPDYEEYEGFTVVAGSALKARNIVHDWVIAIHTSPSGKIGPQAKHEAARWLDTKKTVCFSVSLDKPHVVLAANRGA